NPGCCDPLAQCFQKTTRFLAALKALSIRRIPEIVCGRVSLIRAAALAAIARRSFRPGRAILDRAASVSLAPRALPVEIAFRDPRQPATHCPACCPRGNTKVLTPTRVD